MSEHVEVWRPPSPSYAIRNAIGAAENGDFERARTWTLIARELRIGSEHVCRVHPVNEFDDSTGSLAPCIPIGCDAGRHVPGCFYEGYGEDSESFAGDRLQVIPDAAIAADVTGVMNLIRSSPDPGVAGGVIIHDPNYVDPPGTNRCAAEGCGHVIELRYPSEPHEHPTWVHRTTGQRVCPVSAPDRGHTFATPRVDERG